MPTDIVIPSLGESISEGVIASWLKQEGDYVERDEPVIELETDKITTEIPAPAAGVVHPTANEGDTVEVGQTIGSIEEAEKPAESDEKDKADEAEAAPSKEKQPARKKAAKKSTAKKERRQREAEEKEAAKEQEEAPQARKRATEPARVGEGAASKPETGAGAPGLRAGPEAHATPLARKMAEEHGVDLDQLSGTGAGGRIREQDVLAWIQTHPNGSPAASAKRETAPEASPAQGAPGRESTRQRMSPLRQRIAQRLVEAQQTAAMLTTFNECDMSAVMDLRNRYKESFEKQHGVRLGFMSFFVKACVSALNTFGRVNSQIGENDQGEPEIIHFEYCDIAVAVGTDKGLVVPVLRNCERLSFAMIESGVRDLAEKAQKGKLALEDLQGGTFTISNGGVYGSMLSTPILNPPQSAILGMHNIMRRPLEDPSKPGSGEMTVRPMMYLALSYDHRLIDGAEAVGFLKHVKECIEDPERLLLDV